MAIDKDPSIYRDRGTIGSSDELDEYGVWVKSEPQVLRADSAGSIKDADSALPDIEDLPDLDLELGGEASGEFASSDAVPEPTEELVPDFSDLPTFSLDEDEGTGLDEPGSDQLASTDGDESFSELSMDDFLEVDEEESESAPSTDEFISDPTANEEIALETVSDFDDFLNDLSDQSAPTPPPVEAESIDSMPELDIDLEMGDEEPQQIMSNDDISVDLSASDGQPETAAEKDASEEQFDDVAALGLEMAEPGRESPRSKPDLSTELLMRIADELSSIKDELASLKGELTVLRSVAKAEPNEEQPQHEEPHGFFDEEEDETIALTGDELDNILNTADFTEEAGSDAGAEIEMGVEPEEDESLGFLSDKPDIVFDEPSAEEISEQIPEEAAPADEILPDETFGEDSVESVEEQASEAFGLEDDRSAGDEPIGEEEPGIEVIDILDESSLDEPVELAELRESGVVPMTEAPEDTSYLEEEAVDSSGLTEEIDLSEAVIEEPDLGDFALEEPQIEEPSIDSIDIDLDLEENLHVEEIVLPSEPKEESFEEVLPEGFVVEADDAVPEPVEEELESEELAGEGETLEGDAAGAPAAAELPQNLKQEVRAVLSYMDQLLESLPESKIEEFARSEYFDTYKKLFEELGIA